MKIVQQKKVRLVPSAHQFYESTFLDYFLSSQRWIVRDGQTVRVTNNAANGACCLVDGFNVFGRSGTHRESEKLLPSAAELSVL